MCVVGKGSVLPGSPLCAWVSLPPAPSCTAPSSRPASFSPRPVCSASPRLGPHLSTAHRPAARKAADAQQAALGEPPESARAARLGEEGAGAAPTVPTGAAECGVGEVGRHHPAGGPGHHRPPDRGLSGRAAATHRATDEGRCSARSCRRTGTDTLVGSGRGPRPGLRALGRRPGRGPQCWDQSQTGQETAAWRRPLNSSKRGREHEGIRPERALPTSQAQGRDSSQRRREKQLLIEILDLKLLRRPGCFSLNFK